MKIPLFDLDGTLIKSDHDFKLNRFSFAIEKIFGIKVDLNRLVTHGMIDSQILIELLALHNVPKEKSEEKLQEMFFVMEEFLNQNEDKMFYKPLDGAFDLLKKLNELNIPSSVLTGNVECFGWNKLRKTDLKQFIFTGVFGNMALVRSDLVPIILEKLQLECDEQIQKSNLVIVGDTPLDIKCAKDAGIYSVGVATGKYSKKDLEDCGADLVVESLSEQKLLDYLLN